MEFSRFKNLFVQSGIQKELNKGKEQLKPEVGYAVGKDGRAGIWLNGFLCDVVKAIYCIIELLADREKCNVKEITEMLNEIAERKENLIREEEQSNEKS